MFETNELALDRLPELAAYLQRLLSLGIERLDQLAMTEPAALADALRLDPGESADLVEYAQRVLRALEQG